MRSSAEVAERYCAAKPGFRLLACEEAGVPMFWLTLDAIIQERKRLPALHEYVLRILAAGLDTIAAIAGLLGVEHNLVENAVTDLWGHDYVDYPAMAGFGRNLRLTASGLQSLDELMLQTPRRTEIWVAFDRILWEPVQLRRAEMLAPREAQEVELQELRPRKQARPELPDLPVEKLDLLLKGTMQRSEANLDVLSLRGVLRAERMFLPAHLLVYQSEDGKETEVGVAVDGRRSVDHDEALMTLGGPAFLNISTLLTPSLQIDLDVALPPEEAERVRQTAVPLEEVERIRTRTANARATLEELELVDLAEERAVPAKEFEAAEAGVDEQLSTIDSLEVREIDTFEHALLFQEFRRGTRKRLLVISPWISGRVVTKHFLDELQGLARKKVEIHIGYGIDDDRAADDRDRWAEDQLRKLGKDFSNVVVARLGDTHAKVLISDDTVIVGSFNWLSFRGDQQRAYRQERGMLVKMKSTVDASYLEHRQRIELAAAPPSPV